MLNGQFSIAMSKKTDGNGHDWCYFGKIENCKRILPPNS